MKQSAKLGFDSLTGSVRNDLYPDVPVLTQDVVQEPPTRFGQLPADFHQSLHVCIRLLFKLFHLLLTLVQSLQPVLDNLPALYELAVSRRIAGPFSGQILSQLLIGLCSSFNALFPGRFIPAFPPLGENFIRLRRKSSKRFADFIQAVVYLGSMLAQFSVYR